MLDPVRGAILTWQLAVRNDPELPTADSSPLVKPDPQANTVFHAIWMLSVVRNQGSSTNSSSFLWLGYAQGILITEGRITHDELELAMEQCKL